MTDTARTVKGRHPRVKAWGGRETHSTHTGAFFMPERKAAMRIFDSDGAPYSYEHLGRLAPQPPDDWYATGRLYVEIPVTDFETGATNEDELIADLVRAYTLKDADVLDFDMEQS